MYICSFFTEIAKLRTYIWVFPQFWEILHMFIIYTYLDFRELSADICKPNIFLVTDPRSFKKV